MAEKKNPIYETLLTRCTVNAVWYIRTNGEVRHPHRVTGENSGVFSERARLTRPRARTVNAEAMIKRPAARSLVVSAEFNVNIRGTV